MTALSMRHIREKLEPIDPNSVRQRRIMRIVRKLLPQLERDFPWVSRQSLLDGSLAVKFLHRRVISEWKTFRRAEKQRT